MAAVLCGTDALDSLRIYRAADIASQWGAAPFIDATIERLGAVPVLDSEETLAQPTDRDDLAELVRLVHRLQAA